VHAASVNPYDWHMVRGDPRIARLMGGVGLTKPKTRIAGVDVAGVILFAGNFLLIFAWTFTEAAVLPLLVDPGAAVRQ
jgi:hypothetical protein